MQVILYRPMTAYPRSETLHIRKTRNKIQLFRPFLSLVLYNTLTHTECTKLFPLMLNPWLLWFFCLTPLMSRVIVLAVMERNSADASDIFFSQLCLNNHQHKLFATGALCVKSKTVQMRKASIFPPPPPHTHTHVKMTKIISWDTIFYIIIVFSLIISA